jgi:hypothetical protein
MCLLFSLSSIYFLTTGIQFWITDYMVVVLGADMNNAFLYFVVIAITGPVLGVIVGGYVFSRIGGYNDPRAFPAATIAIVSASAFGVPSIFADNMIVLVFLVWA